MTTRSDSTLDEGFIARSYAVPDVVRHYAAAAAQLGLCEAERKTCTRYLATHDRVLDVGCGAGRTTIGLYREGFVRIYGVDLSLPMIAAARVLATHARLDVPLTVGNACNLPFKTESFDGALFSFNGLMQIPRTENRVRALQELRRVLKTGGHLIFTTPEREGRSARSRLFWEQQRNVWQQGRQDPRLTEFGDVLVSQRGDSLTYLHFPTIGQVAALARRAGLKRVEYRNRRQICSETPAIESFIGGMEFIVWVTRK
jgi:ubiquinone/menaquinone biosynthesis C-methylase UbiE